MEYSEFKNFDFYPAFDSWLCVQLSVDFLTIPDHDDDERLESDWKFDDEGYIKTFDDSVVAGLRIYNETDHDPLSLRGKSFEEMLDMAGVEDRTHIREEGVYGALFLAVVADYSNIEHRMGNVYWRAFEEVVDGWFRGCTDLHTWLTFYSTFIPFRYRSLLPEKLRNAKMEKYWKKLKDKGFIDEKYQIVYTGRIKNYHVRLIANNLHLESGCRWKDLEEFFVQRDGKPFKNLRKENAIFIRDYPDDPLVDEIKECFR